MAEGKDATRFGLPSLGFYRNTSSSDPRPMVAALGERERGVACISPTFIASALRVSANGRRANRYINSAARGVGGTRGFFRLFGAALTGQRLTNA
jgi:hypothetical protein